MKEMLKNAGILLAITVIAGFVLGAVYQITKGPIAEAEAAATMQAYKEVFADASDFSEMEVNTGALAAGGIVGTDIDKVLEAKGADGAVLGYVFVITNHEGYAGVLPDHRYLRVRRHREDARTRQRGADLHSG